MQTANTAAIIGIIVARPTKILRKGMRQTNHNSQVRPPIFSTAGTPFKISIILEELFQRCSKIHWFYTSITLILTKVLLTWIIRRLVKILLALVDAAVAVAVAKQALRNSGRIQYFPLLDYRIFDNIS